VIRVTRRYGFSAAHVLAREDWDETRNRETYGKCANPAGHGHNYLLEVTVRGSLDRESGRVMRHDDLDRVVRERVIGRLEGRFLNRELEAFRSSVPTAENIARFALEALRGHVAPAELDAVRLEETAKNSVELEEEAGAWVASKV
jgi:6-pyruvoyltetrahydropterin/6-carboxytetrahydropterin synthase